MNENEALMICPQCNGRRVVFNPMSLLLTVVLPLALLLDLADDNGITKRKCPTCLGRGVILEVE